MFFVVFHQLYGFRNERSLQSRWMFTFDLLDGVKEVLYPLEGKVAKHVQNPDA